MADIFGGVEPPRWLTAMTAQRPGELGQIVGELVGGFASSAEVAIDRATTKQGQGEDTNWIKEMPGSIQEGFYDARMSLQNAQWRMQTDQAKLNMAQQGLSIQNQTSEIAMRSQKLRMQQHDQEEWPKWLQDHPTWESRQTAEPPNLLTPEFQRGYRQIQMGDASNTKQKAFVEGTTAFAKSVSELQKMDAPAAAQFAQYIGKVPTPEIQNKLAAAMEAAKVKMQPVPMVIPLPDGRSISGVYNPNTKKFETAKDPTEAIKLRAQEKDIEERQKADIDVAKDKVKQAYRATLDVANQGKDKQIKLQAEYAQAKKELAELTSRPPAGPAAPAPDKSGDFSFEDFQKSRAK